MNKTELVLNVIDEQKLDVLAITETFLKVDHPPAIKDDLVPPGFDIQHVHRPDKRGGAIAVVSRESLYARPFNLVGKYTSFEVSTVYLWLPASRLNLLTIYRPPKSTGFFTELQDFLDEVVALPGGLYICGDMNCLAPTAGHVDRQLERLIDDYDLRQHVKEQTHKHDGILDFIITRPQDPQVSKTCVEDIGFPDHYLVTTTLEVVRPWPVRATFVARNIKAMDVTSFRSKMLASDVCTGPKSTTNDFADQLMDSVIGVLDQLPPSRRMTKRCGKPSNK